MWEAIKFLIAAIVGVMEALPQVSTDSAGVSTKIPDEEYSVLISGGVVGMIKGAGFQIAGYTDPQIAGVAAAMVGLVRAWKTAARVSV